MADRKPAAVELREQRLHVAQNGLAGRRIAHVAHGRDPGQALDHLAAGEVVTDEPQPPLGMKSPAIERDDAGGLLAAVLERVQAEGGDRRRVRMSEYAEDAALFTQPVAVEVEAGIVSSFGHLISSSSGERVQRALLRVKSRRLDRSAAPYWAASGGPSRPER